MRETRNHSPIPSDQALMEAKIALRALAERPSDGPLSFVRRRPVAASVAAYALGLLSVRSAWTRSLIRAAAILGAKRLMSDAAASFREGWRSRDRR